MSVNPNTPIQLPQIPAASPGYTAGGEDDPNVFIPQDEPASYQQAGWTPDQWAEYRKYLVQQARVQIAQTGQVDRGLQLQIYDAAQGHQNALDIARTSAAASMYGTDANYQSKMAELNQNAQQFEANHALDYAKAYTSFAQTPDQVFAMNDFKDAVGRTMAGSGPSYLSTSSTPHAKTFDDFTAIAGNPYAGGGDGSGGSGGGKDKRIKAAAAIMDAMPPSDGIGHTGQDWAAIDSIKNLYFSGKPGVVEALGPARRKIAQAGLARDGYDPQTVEDDRTQVLPNQGSVRSAYGG